MTKEHGTPKLSWSIEVLIGEAPLDASQEPLITATHPESKQSGPIDVLIVGSGYGAAIAAMRLAGAGRRVVVLERGREYALGEFPESIGDLPGHVSLQSGGEAPGGYPDALFDLRIGDGMDVLVGNGLGGTSLINANVAIEPDASVFLNPAWPVAFRTPGVLNGHFQTIRNLLSVNNSPAFAKSAALDRLGEAISATCISAPISVAQTQGLNAVALNQEACTNCGNCVTGCNVGAKGTLMMNLLPLARTRGAEFYTGATVLSISHILEEDETKTGEQKSIWHVRFRRTASERTPLEDEVYRIAAHKVILAAGTLGSTEILLRTQAFEPRPKAAKYPPEAKVLKKNGEALNLKFSGLLGQNFSGNGDNIATGFAQRTAVNCIGTPTQSPAAALPDAVGPTITKIIRLNVRDPDTGRSTPLTIEDAAIPHAIRTIFAEALTTAAMVQRLGNPDLPQWFRDTAKADHDPLAASPELLMQAQQLLLMGDDGALGNMSLKYPKYISRTTGHDRARLSVSWPDAGNNPALKAGHALLSAQDRKAGLDEGQYIPNPMWKPLPDAAAGLAGDSNTAGRALSVHPLGGCVMGDTHLSGVVDDIGRVFNPEGGIHKGLYVMDGAIVPMAVGTNPFLTISALAWRACDALLLEAKWTKHDAVQVGKAWKNPRRVSPNTIPSGPVSLLFKETMGGALQNPPAWVNELLPGDLLTHDITLVLQTTLAIEDMDAWLAKPHANATAVATGQLKYQLRDPDPRWSGKQSIQDADLQPLIELGQATTATIRLFVPDSANGITKLWRTAKALLGYDEQRQRLLAAAIKALTKNEKGGLLDGAKGFRSVAEFQANYRTMEYKFVFPHQTLGDITLTGIKLLAWRNDSANVWQSLIDMPITLSCSTQSGTAQGSLRVDLLRMLNQDVPEITQMPHLPEALSKVTQFAMLFVRNIFNTRFWDFGAPDYPTKALERDKGPEQLKLGANAVVQAQTSWLSVPVSIYEPDKYQQVRLVRYPAQSGTTEAQGAPVLLLHGLAQGSSIFTTSTLDNNMATSLWKRGFDVWVVDYRISPLLPGGVATGKWGIEDIAQYDIAAAVKHILTECNDQTLSIFAHCIGATAINMAILEGWVDSKKLRALATNAIHPWITPSKVNLNRAAFGAIIRSAFNQEILDPVPSPNPSAAQVMLDRFAFSFARFDEEVTPDKSGHDHKDDLINAVCDRMSVMYGHMWRHVNLDPRTHSALPQLVGPASLTVYQQTYHFARRKRLTDKNGKNTLLRASKIQANWHVPVLFMHGEKSCVFSPYSASLSHNRMENILSAIVLPPRVLPPPRVLSKRFAELGHMDVVFSKPAVKDVFPLLGDFFLRDHTGEFDPKKYDNIANLTLPTHEATPIVIRSAKKVGNAVHLKCWVELPDEGDGEAYDIADNGTPRGSTAIKSNLSDTNYPDQNYHYIYRIFDLPLVDGVAPSLTVRYAGVETTKCLPILDRQPSWLQRLSETNKSGVCFIAASCRYPGTPLDRKESDKAYLGMIKHLTGDDSVDRVFLLGDQIYADATANMIDSESWRERYVERYRTAFRSENFKSLASNVPIHFAIDDHEINDSWSGDAPQEGFDTRRTEYAMRAARNFMAPGATTPLWYAIESPAESGCPAFVLDTRSERTLRTRDADAPEIMSDEQFAALTDWLNKNKAVTGPKFIFSGVVMAPVRESFASEPATWRDQDGWAGYPATLHKLIKHIVTEQIQGVVFVGGDLHLSAFAEMTFQAEGKPPVKAWQIVSSAIYAPMPFANAQARDFTWNTPVTLPVAGYPDVSVHYTASLLSCERSQFVKVMARPSDDQAWIMTIGLFDADGNALPITTSPTGSNSITVSIP